MFAYGPAIPVVLSCHWKAAPAPVPAALNVAMLPEQTVVFKGSSVIAGNWFTIIFLDADV